MFSSFVEMFQLITCFHDGYMVYFFGLNARTIQSYDFRTQKYPSSINTQYTTQELATF